MSTTKLNQDDILNRFSPEFREKMLTDPMCHAIYILLLQGVDECKIIEQLLKLRKRTFDEIDSLINGNRPVYVINKEDYDKIKGT